MFLKDSAVRELRHGPSDAETAAKLHLSVNIVKTHISSLFAGLHVRDRVQLVTAPCQREPLST